MNQLVDTGLSDEGTKYEVLAGKYSTTPTFPNRVLTSVGTKYWSTQLAELKYVQTSVTASQSSPNYPHRYINSMLATLSNTISSSSGASTMIAFSNNDETSESLTSLHSTQCNLSSIFISEEGASVPANHESNLSSNTSTNLSTMITLPMKCISLQLEEFIEQTKELVNLSTIHNTACNSSSDNAEGISVTFADKSISFTPRGVDDFQVILMNTLDSDGNISSPARVTILTILMTRVTLTDHRAICLYILTDKTSSHCQKEFIKQGGLRIIRRWVTSAMTADRIDELRVIIKSLRKLPVDTKELLRSKLNKNIKDLAKLESKHHEIKQLLTETRAYKDYVLSFVARPSLPNDDPSISQFSAIIVEELRVQIAEVRRLYPTMFGGTPSSVVAEVTALPVNSEESQPIGAETSIQALVLTDKENPLPDSSANPSLKDVTKDKSKVSRPPPSAMLSVPVARKRPKPTPSLIETDFDIEMEKQPIRIKPIDMKQFPVLDTAIVPTPDTIVSVFEYTPKSILSSLNSPRLLKKKLTWIDERTPNTQLTQVFVFESEELSETSTHYIDDKEMQKKEASDERLAKMKSKEVSDSRRNVNEPIAVSNESTRENNSSRRAPLDRWGTLDTSAVIPEEISRVNVSKSNRTTQPRDRDSSRTKSTDKTYRNREGERDFYGPSDKRDEPSWKKSRPNDRDPSDRRQFIPCKNFTTKDGCRFGDSCLYKHELKIK